jgi:hypothetical protein
MSSRSHPSHVNSQKHGVSRLAREVQTECKRFEADLEQTSAGSAEVKVCPAAPRLLGTPLGQKTLKM